MSNLTSEQQQQAIESSVAASLAAIASQMPSTTTSAANGLFSLSALAALQPALGAGLPMSPTGACMSFVHSSGNAAEAEAKLIEYRGEKVAGFEIETDTMICLPQAYEMFLKNLVGGLHTVYTKLKRLEIVPRVCNVEQVRALRSLGAIQPGVNRCKLISCKDFDVLYDDCTNTKLVGINDIVYSFNPRPAPNNICDSKPPHINGAHGAATVSNGMSSPTSPILNPAVSMAPLLSPFSAAAAQQFVMQQMMATNSLLQQAACAQNGQHNSNRFNSQSPETTQQPKLWMDEHAAAIDGSCPLNLTKPDQSPSNGNHKTTNQHTDEQSPDISDCEGDMEDYEDNGHNSEDIPDSESPNNEAANNNENGDQNAQAANFANLINSWTQGPSSAQAAAAAKFNPYNSVQGLLINVLGLIELAAATARTQEEQHNNEKSEITTALTKERSDKQSMESQLTTERRLRKMYQKRWRLAKKSKDDLQAQVIKLMSRTKAHNDQNNFQNGLGEQHDDNPSNGVLSDNQDNDKSPAGSD